jgi:TetR/AcrR family tetracycline transcriptional repressor
MAAGEAMRSAKVRPGELVDARGHQVDELGSLPRHRVVEVAVDRDGVRRVQDRRLHANLQFNVVKEYGSQPSLTLLSCQVMRGALTKTAIVQAALDLLDEAGTDGLTLRALAARLGVQAPALYWHVASKQALLDEMATLIWRGIGEVMAGLPGDLDWREVMRTYAVTVRGELLGHRDGAKAFSGTTLTDPGVVRRQEVTFENLIRQGFTLPDAVRGLLLVHSFTIGFCVEEQAVIQVTAAGDDSYSPARRAELIGPESAPLAVEAGPVLFGDPDTRFGELLGLVLDAVGRTRG